MNETTKIKVRDQGIDVLRWMAITGIIIVHVNPPLFWQQIRSFDVPLMVLLSGICFGTTKIFSKEYYKKRFIRLVIPSWIFLSFYFLITYISSETIEIKRIVMCYTFMTSWYFWIIRILFVMALLAPLFALLSNKIDKSRLFLIIILLIVISEVLAKISDDYLYVVGVMFIPYATYYLIGMNLYRFSTPTVLKTGIILLCIYVLIAIYLYTENGRYILTSSQKYPPQFYYSSYAIGVSLVLYSYRNKIVSGLNRIKLLNFTLFIGSNTFWIYLWHIPLADYMINRFAPLYSFIVVYGFAIILTFIQSKVVNAVCQHTEKNVGKFIRMIFLG